MLTEITYRRSQAYLCQLLREIPEDDGTMLDHTLILWGNELGTGNHSNRNVPWLLAGNVDGYFRAGRLVSAPRVAHNKLLVSVIQAMGLPGEWFGDREHGIGELPGLTA